MRYKMMLMVAAFLTVCTVFLAAPVEAIIVHHCSYAPGVNDEIHDRHGDQKCGNVDSSGEGHDGECEVGNSYYWSDLKCDLSGCIAFGKVDCGSNDKTYYFECPGDGTQKARVEIDRYSATCDSPISGEDYSCTCSSCP